MSRFILRTFSSTSSTLRIPGMTVAMHLKRHGERQADELKERPRETQTETHVRVRDGELQSRRSQRHTVVLADALQRRHLLGSTVVLINSTHRHARAHTYTLVSPPSLLSPAAPRSAGSRKWRQPQYLHHNNYISYIHQYTFHVKCIHFTSILTVKSLRNHFYISMFSSAIIVSRYRWPRCPWRMAARQNSRSFVAHRAAAERRERAGLAGGTGLPRECLSFL